MATIQQVYTHMYNGYSTVHAWMYMHALLSAHVDAYWKPLVEELAPEIGDQPAIIYVDSKKAAIDLTTSFIQHTSIKTAAYTGEDTSKSDKKAVISNWSDEEVTLIIATSAFGLGVNKDNVHTVYHLGVPNSLETWMQQAGRGGRNGTTCTGMCNVTVVILLFGTPH